MKNLLSILLATFFISSCGNAQKKETIFDPIVLKAKETSLYTEQVNWEEVNKKFIDLTAGKQDVEDLKEGLQYLINSLGDKHATIRSTENYSIVVSYTGKIKKDVLLERDSDFINNVMNDITSQFSYKLLEGRIAYLRVVGIGPGIVKEQADIIRNGLLSLKKEGVEKWIVDLRYNGGGNMEPMISGLAPLIGEGYIGGTANNKNEVSRTYKIENGEFNNYGRIACKMDNLPEINPSEKVAVLLSRYTISSGEMVAVAFKGRDNTRFIGEGTAGYTTGNGYDKITDELALVISQDIFMDRNNVAYPINVGVDDKIAFMPIDDFKKDKHITRAIEWLDE